MFVYAAALAYYFIFALFPFFIFLTALLAYLPIPNLMDQIIGLLAQVMPGEALTLVEKNLGALLSEPSGGLLSFGILAALWTSSSAIVAISDALNHAYNVEEGRPFWRVRGMAILLTDWIIDLHNWFHRSPHVRTPDRRLDSRLCRFGSSIRDRVEYFALAGDLCSW